MSEFIKKNIYLIIIFIITLFIGFLTFLTFLDKSFIDLSDRNLQLLLILNIGLLFILFLFIFIEIKKAIKNDITKDGLQSNNKYIKFQDNFEDNASNIKDKIEEETEIVIINETKKLDTNNN